MTQHAFGILVFAGFTILYFCGAWYFLRDRNRNRIGWRIAGSIQFLAAFQLLAFTFIMVTNPDSLRLANAVGWPLLVVLPIMMCQILFIAIRLLYGKNPE